MIDFLCILYMLIYFYLGKMRMNILLVDDDKFTLQETENAVSEAVPTAQCFSFQNSQEALAFAETTPIDIALWGIDMNLMPFCLKGIFSTQALANIYPDCNIIYCIDCDKYVKDVPRIKQSNYLLKPITPEKVQVALARLKCPLTV